MMLNDSDNLVEKVDVTPDNRLSGLMRDTLFLTLDRVSQILTTIICTGLIGRAVGVEAFGHWQLAMLFLFMLVALANVATPEFSIPRMVGEANKAREALAAVWTVRAVTSATLGVVAGLIVLFSATEPTTGWLFFLLLPSLIREPGLAMQSWHTARKTVLPYMLTSVTTLLFRLGLTVILFLFEFDLVWFAVPVIAENLVHFALFRRQFVKVVRPQRITIAAAFDLFKPKPLMWSWLAMLLTLLSLRVDRLISPWFMDEKTFGLYTAATQLSDNWFFVGVLLSGTIGSAYVYNASTCQDAIKSSLFWAALVFGAVAIVAIITIFIAPLVVHIIFGEAFADAAPILIWSMAAFALVPVNMVLSLPIVREKRLDLIALKGLCAVLVVLCLLFISGSTITPRFAIMCVAAGQLVSMCFSGGVLIKWSIQHRAEM